MDKHQAKKQQDDDWEEWDITDEPDYVPDPTSPDDYDDEDSCWSASYAWYEGKCYGWDDYFKASCVDDGFWIATWHTTEDGSYCEW